MNEGQRIHVLGNFFRITFIENPGMAFGFNPGINFKLWISIFSIIASIGLIAYIYRVRNQSLVLRLSLAFILGGAIGNLIDRMFYGIFYGYAPLFYGHVVDFLDFDFFHFSLFGRTFDRWPIFNIADASVTIGVIILLFFYNQKHREETREKTSGDLEEMVNLNSSIPENSQEDSKDGEADSGKEISL
jgi:signal peptidase II